MSSTSRAPGRRSRGAGELTTILSESFDGIYLDLSKESGKCRFAETGFGWKPAGGGDTFTLDHSNIGGAQWSRASKGYEVRILQRSSGIIQLDGFHLEDYDRLSKVFKNWYSTVLENKEHALRGWNWGKAEFSKAELVFNVQNKPAFEIPYSEVANTNLAGRNEVAVELSLPQDANDTGTAGQGGARGKGKKAGAGRDQLVEMRFYIPGTATKMEAEGGEDAASDYGEEQNAATLFYETLIEKAEIGEMAGDTIATFLDVLHLTPRSVAAPLSQAVWPAPSSNHPTAGVASTLTCTRPRFVSAARRTTTRSSTTPSKSSWSCPSPTTCTACSASAWTPLCGRARRAIPLS